MQPYVFGKRNGIYIVDLQKTVQCFNKAYEFIRDMAKTGAIVLFVGTKNSQPMLLGRLQRNVIVPMYVKGG